MSDLRPYLIVPLAFLLPVGCADKTFPTCDNLSIPVVSLVSPLNRATAVFVSGADIVYDAYQPFTITLVGVGILPPVPVPSPLPSPMNAYAGGRLFAVALPTLMPSTLYEVDSTSTSSTCGSPSQVSESTLGEFITK